MNTMSQITCRSNPTLKSEYMSACTEGTMITQIIMRFTDIKVASAHAQSGPITINGCLLKLIPSEKYKHSYLYA